MGFLPTLADGSIKTKMEVKTSKVIKAEPTGRTWSANGNTYHVHSIEMENGDKGEYSSVNPAQGKFIQGANSTYEYHPPTGNFPAKLKPKQSDSPTYSGKYQGKNGHGNVASFALSYAKDIYIAKQQAISATAMTEDQMFRLADRMHDWLKSKEA